MVNGTLGIAADACWCIDGRGRPPPRQPPKRRKTALKQALRSIIEAKRPAPATSLTPGRGAAAWGLAATGSHQNAFGLKIAASGDQQET
jgi:hypothetical protein